MGDVYRVVGVSERRVDGRALVTGAPVFVGDRPPRPGTLHVALVRSPHAHARIRSIDVSEAAAAPGVVLVLTHENTPALRYTTAGQGFPEPSPYDARMFDTKVRFVGDRVAAVAADSVEAAREAASLVRVVYELLPPVLSLDAARAERAPVIHDEPDCVDVWDPAHNVAAHVVASVGDVEAALASSEKVVEVSCETHYAQHVPLEPHVVSTYLDEDGRLVIVSSTQVPFHVRRIVARLLDVPAHRIRVVKPRIGGGFGVKQEVLIEDIVALVTLRTGRPAVLTYTREEETVSSRTRHPMRVDVTLGAGPDGVLTAVDMEVLSNTGAYGTHALTVLSNVGSKSLPLYNTAPAIRFRGDAVYTNLPVAGAYRGYGGTQGQFAVETAMDRLAAELGMDPVELRRRNHIRAGGTSPIFAALGEGREGVPQVVASCALDECIRVGAERIDWAATRGARRRDGSWVHGVGMSVHMQGSGIAGVDMASASLKMNDDGSFNLLVGATDLGTGSDTVLAQIAAEVLGVPLDKIVVLSSDTDLTPFDTGAYASSTTYVSGTAVERAARDVAAQIREVAATMLGVGAEILELGDERVGVPDGESVTLRGGGAPHPVRRRSAPDRGGGVVRPRRQPAAVPGELRRGGRRSRDRGGPRARLRGGRRLRDGDQPGAGRRSGGGGDRQRDRLRPLRGDGLHGVGPVRLHRPRPLQDRLGARHPAHRGHPRRVVRADRPDGGEIGGRDRHQRPPADDRLGDRGRRRHPPHRVPVHPRTALAGDVRLAGRDSRVTPPGSESTWSRGPHSGGGRRAGRGSRRPVRRRRPRTCGRGGCGSPFPPAGRQRGTPR